jgi:hypothetical protein
VRACEEPRIKGIQHCVLCFVHVRVRWRSTGLRSGQRPVAERAPGVSGRGGFGAGGLAGRPFGCPPPRSPHPHPHPTPPRAERCAGAGGHRRRQGAPGVRVAGARRAESARGRARRPAPGLQAHVRPLRPPGGTHVGSCVGWVGVEGGECRMGARSCARLAYVLFSWPTHAGAAPVSGPPSACPSPRPTMILCPDPMPSTRSASDLPDAGRHRPRGALRPARARVAPARARLAGRLGRLLLRARLPHRRRRPRAPARRHRGLVHGGEGVQRCKH